MIRTDRGVTVRMRRIPGSGLAAPRAYGPDHEGNRRMAGPADGDRTDHAVSGMRRAPDHDHHAPAGAGIADAGRHGDHLIRYEAPGAARTPSPLRGRVTARPP